MSSGSGRAPDVSVSFPLYSTGTSSVLLPIPQSDGKTEIERERERQREREIQRKKQREMERRKETTLQRAVQDTVHTITPQGSCSGAKRMEGVFEMDQK